MGKSKGEIVSLGKCFDNATCEPYWEIIIHAVDDKPDLKLGECKVIQ